MRVFLSGDWRRRNVPGMALRRAAANIRAVVASPAGTMTGLSNRAGGGGGSPSDSVDRRGATPGGLLSFFAPTSRSREPTPVRKVR